MQAVFNEAAISNHFNTFSGKQKTLRRLETYFALLLALSYLVKFLSRLEIQTLLSPFISERITF